MKEEKIGSATDSTQRSERVGGQERSAEKETHELLPSSDHPEVETADQEVLARINLLDYHRKRGLLFPGMDERNNEIHGLIDALLLAVRAEQAAEIERLHAVREDVTQRMTIAGIRAERAEAEIQRLNKELEKRDTSAQAVVSIAIYREAIARAGSAEAALKAHGWQPIETAPKDGTSVVVSGDGRIDMACWQDEQELEYESGVIVELGRPEGWWGSDCYPGNWQPTVWQPLPPAPVQTAQEKTE